MLKGLYVLDSDAFERIYSPSVRSKIEEKVNICEPPLTAGKIRDQLFLLEDIDVIFTGWGAPLLDEVFLQAAPRLKAVFHGSGSIKRFVTDAFWNRNIRITSAYAANAVPVAEYTLSQIIFSLKRGWHFVNMTKNHSNFKNKHEAGAPGVYGSIVGIISLGIIGRRVCELMKHFDVNVIAYDPYASKEEAASLHVNLCSLEELFKLSDVVSLHAPWLQATEGMITGKHFEMMKQNASFINTSRGAIVRENEMIEVLQKRLDIQAILDVTYPEPPVQDSPLYTMPNVVLTPHIAGSVSYECARMGEYVLKELEQFIANKPPIWGITQEKASMMA